MLGNKHLLTVMKRCLSTLQSVTVSPGASIEQCLTFVCKYIFPTPGHLRSLSIPRLIPPPLVESDLSPQPASVPATITVPWLEPVVAALRSAHSLTTLKLGAFTTNPDNEIPLIKVIPTTLTHLSLEMRNYENLKPVFEHCTSLQTLEFRTTALHTEYVTNLYLNLTCSEFIYCGRRVASAYGSPADLILHGKYQIRLTTLKLTMVTTSNEFWRLISDYLPTLRCLHLIFCKIKAKNLSPAPQLREFVSMSLDASEYVFVDLADAVCANFHDLTHFGLYYFENCENYPLAEVSFVHSTIIKKSNSLLPSSTQLAAGIKSMSKLESIDLVGYATNWELLLENLPHLQRLKYLDAVAAHPNDSNRAPTDSELELRSGLKVIKVPDSAILPFASFPKTPIPTSSEIDYIFNLNTSSSTAGVTPLIEYAKIEPRSY